MLQRIREVAERALAGGQLQPIETHSTWCADGGMTFLIRQVASLRRKPHTRAEDWPVPSGQPVDLPSAGCADAPVSPPNNPFLPYDPAMFVADVSATHLALLNKFPVVANHLLIVTRRFELQSTRLTRADFEALALCQMKFASLGFYNSGTMAGASQPHRHLQLIPLPLAERPPDLPIDVLLQRTSLLPTEAQPCKFVPFEHRWIGIPSTDHPQSLADSYARAYDHLLSAYGWDDVAPPTPYNLLATRRWMMLVPRRAEAFHGISLNSMAFVGALLVRTHDELEQLQAAGPMQALVATAGSLSS